jgi:hypothetical protein
VVASQRDTDRVKELLLLPASRGAPLAGEYFGEMSAEFADFRFAGTWRRRKPAATIAPCNTLVRLVPGLRVSITEFFTEFERNLPPRLRPGPRRNSR